MRCINSTYRSVSRDIRITCDIRYICALLRCVQGLALLEQQWYRRCIVKRVARVCPRLAPCIYITRRRYSNACRIVRAALLLLLLLHLCVPFC
jgi:hypothetical protein